VGVIAAPKDHTLHRGLPSGFCVSLRRGPWPQPAEQRIPPLDRIVRAPYSLHVPALRVPAAHLPAPTCPHRDLNKDAKRLPMD